MTATLRYAVLDGIMLEIHDQRAPSDADWDAMLDHFDAHTDEALGAIVLSDGPGPNAAQRKRLAERLRGRRIQTVVITDSLVARGAVTALRWVGHAIQAFASSDLERAIASFSFLPEQRRRVLLRMVELRYELAGQPAAAELGQLDEAALAEHLRQLRASSAA